MWSSHQVGRVRVLNAGRSVQPGSAQTDTVVTESFWSSASGRVPRSSSAGVSRSSGYPRRWCGHAPPPLCGACPGPPARLQPPMGRGRTVRDEPVASGDVSVGLVGGVGQRVSYGVEDGVPAGAEFLVAAVLGDGDDIAGVDGDDEGLGSEGGGVVPGADVQAGGAAVVSVVADLGAGHFHDRSGWVGDVPDVGGAVDGGAAGRHGVVVLVVLDALVADEAAVGGEGHVPVGEPGEQLLAGFAGGVGGEVLHEADEAGVPV